MKPYNYLTQNSKLKKTGKKHGVRAFNWGIPAFKAANGFKTCPNAAACAVGCYAQAGAYKFSNVAAVFEKRLVLAQSTDLVATISAELKRRKVDVLRVHDSGDFFSLEYTQKWFTICQQNPSVRFYAYTKQVKQFQAYAKLRALPANFTVVYSQGGTQDKLIDAKTERHARVFETVEALQAAGYADASNDDLVALGANPKVGLVYHGAKSYKNTNWKKVA